MAKAISLSDDIAAQLLQAVHSRETVLGLTHGFYRYPARFSPLFARAAIRAFTQPGDIVLDPFMGGGTTLVESRVRGRCAIGVDISQLAVFLARTKTTPLLDQDLSLIRDWFRQLELRSSLNLRNPPTRAKEWIQGGYQRNISGKDTWPIRKTLELALAQVNSLQDDRCRRFVRCVLLKTGQWALDCRRTIPSAEEFRKHLFAKALKMLEGIRDYSACAQAADRLYKAQAPFRQLCLNRSAIGIDREPALAGIPAPRLILTSPPYPGVHVLYHRWQVRGRKETPAPFWVADCIDGRGASFYTFGDREQQNLSTYFSGIYEAYASLALIADGKTLLVQMIAFSDPSWQFPKFLETMKQAGFSELRFPVLANSADGRLWRFVPNRKWYAGQKGSIPSSKEVVLFHCRAQT